MGPRMIAFCFFIYTYTVCQLFLEPRLYIQKVRKLLIVFTSYSTNLLNRLMEIPTSTKTSYVLVCVGVSVSAQHSS